MRSSRWHFGLAMQHQRFVNTRPAMPFIEAPSIMNEMLLAQHILAQTQDPRMRRAVLLQVLGTYHHNFVTHLLEAELQRQLYALAEGGGAITAAVLNQTKGRILARFWGDTVTIDDGARLHLARAVTRRAERAAVAAGGDRDLNPLALP